MARYAVAEFWCLLGGSFDPVHRGHVKLAAALHALLPNSRIVMMPAARSPLKQDVTDFKHRVAMLKLATQDHPEIIIDDREGRRPPPSYTIDTLRSCRAEFPDISLGLVIGEDVLADLHRWKSWHELLEVAHLLIISRPHPTSLSPHPEVSAWLQQHAAPLHALKKHQQGLVVHIETPLFEESSTQLRQQLAAGDHPTLSGLHPDVANYISTHHLYLTGAPQNPCSQLPTMTPPSRLP